MSIKQEMIVTGKGFINDFEANLLKLAKMTFEKEDMRFLTDFHPETMISMDPDHLPSQESLPGLYAWVDGFTGESKTLGGKYAYEMSQELMLFCSVKYILPLIETAEANETLNWITADLFQNITENLNLFDMVNGQARVIDVAKYPSTETVDKKLREVSSVSIKLIVPYIRKTKFVTR